MLRNLVTMARVSVTAVFLLVVSAVASAQTPAMDGFVPVTGDDPDVERIPAAPLVFAAYAFVWVAMIAYVFFLWRRLTRVERELADVTAKLEARRR